MGVENRGEEEGRGNERVDELVVDPEIVRNQRENKDRSQLRS